MCPGKEYGGKENMRTGERNEKWIIRILDIGIKNCKRIVITKAEQVLSLYAIKRKLDF